MSTPRWYWQVVSLLPGLPMAVAIGLWAFNVGGPRLDRLWGLASWLLVLAWLFAPALGEPMRNWARMREHLYSGFPPCRHCDWTGWLPNEDGTAGYHCWCRDCGWVMRRGVLTGVPWRYRAGLPRGCGPNVDQAWSPPRRNSEK